MKGVEIITETSPKNPSHVAAIWFCNVFNHNKKQSLQASPDLWSFLIITISVLLVSNLHRFWKKKKKFHMGSCNTSNMRTTSIWLHLHLQDSPQKLICIKSNTIFKEFYKYRYSCHSATYSPCNIFSQEFHLSSED